MPTSSIRRIVIVKIIISSNGIIIGGKYEKILHQVVETKSRERITFPLLLVKYTEPIKTLVHVLIFTINCRVNQSILYAFFKAFCAKVHRNFCPLLYAYVTFTQTVFNVPLYCLNFETLSSLCLVK